MRASTAAGTLSNVPEIRRHQTKVKIMQEDKKTSVPDFIELTRAESQERLRSFYELLDYDQFTDEVLLSQSSAYWENKSLVEQTWQRIWDNYARLQSSTKYTGKELYGERMWKYLRKSARAKVLDITDYLVYNGLLPVTYYRDSADRSYLVHVAVSDEAKRQ